ncbi:hypothetical protein [Frigoriglobus tundricola]|uniref:Uncharacterized protein n=1 Tax=Frigoriglobus tundricola TaxID=2774151 RepID=A0A6M5YF52_9BACT|nr:hypothetical protein [Frigoriglobus tundricola]QJW92637.1 hypothetical protein FTUN_0134 [Frigoriglobus tundricola]
MPAPTSPKSDPDLDAPDLHEDGDGVAVAGPPDAEFWERYNQRMEFPLATVATVFLHVIVFAALIYILVGLMESGEDRSTPPLQLMQVGGIDDAGEGSAGSGGTENPDIVRDVDPFKAAQSVLPTMEALKDAKENIQKIILDENGNMPVAAPNAASYSLLDETVRKKLLGAGAQKGEGNQPGKGFEGTPGSGPGGNGADSTRARGLRWVLRFRVAGGNDYINQLRAMGAEILVPLPPDDKKCILIRDLKDPSAQSVASDADLKRLAGKIQFADTRRDQVRDVLNVLGVNTPGQPKAFWAFFPKELEEELARKETSYRNRRAEDIEETVFKVTIRGGSYELVVDDQVIKH